VLLKALAPSFFAWARRAPVPEPAAPLAASLVADAASGEMAQNARDALRLRPEMEKALLDAGMPPEGSSLYDGPKRAGDTPEAAARRFVLWAQAVGAIGSYPVRTIGALYWECAEVDHREPVAISRFLRALKSTRGIRQGTSLDDRRRRHWVIDPPEPQKVPKAQVAMAAKIAAKMPHLHPRVLQRLAPEQEYSPQLQRAMAHDARRQGRARKQRGSRNVRWAS
jgi:hypothetical protein